MADKLDRQRRSANMAAIRSRDMKPELTVRSLVHSLGYRYRLHARDLPGKPDLVFRLRKKVIFVHGCFWHQHKNPSCADSRLPKSRLEYWLPKLQRNVERDAETMQCLQQLGWSALVIWECETKNMAELTDRLKSFLL